MKKTGRFGCETALEERKIEKEKMDVSLKIENRDRGNPLVDSLQALQE